MQLYASIAIFLLLGILLQLWVKHAKLWSKAINTWILFFNLPLIILGFMHDLDPGNLHWFGPGAAWSLMIASILIGLLAQKVLGWSVQITTCFVLLSALGNTAFLGIGYIDLIWGKSHVPTAILFDQFGSFIILVTLGTIGIAICQAFNASGRNNTDMSGHESSPSIEIHLRSQAKSQLGVPKEDTKNIIHSPKFGLFFWWDVFKKVVKFPPLLTLIIALNFPLAEIVGVIEPAISLAEHSILPLAMLVVGLQLKFKIHAHWKLPLSAILVTKLLVAPILVLAAGNILLVNENTILTASVIQSAMPPMITPALMLIQADIEAEFAAAVVSFGTLVGLISLTLWSLVLSMLL